MTNENGRKAEAHPHADAGAHLEAGLPRADARALPPDASQKSDASVPADAGSTDGAPTDSGAGIVDAGRPATLSGSLRVADLLFVDSDTADPDHPPRSNDTRAAAQPISSPSLVGGYLGTTALGPDAADLYVVDLGKGEFATLYIGTPGPGGPLPDFDLYLYDSAGNLVDSSQGTSPVEVVTAPASGSYFVYAASPAGDAGLYTLAVASAPSVLALRAAAKSKLNAAWPLVPGEALVKLRPSASSRVDAFAGLGAHPLTSGHNAIGYYRVALDPESGVKALASSAPLHDAASTIRAIKRLKRAPNVLYAEPNYRRSLHALPPNDPLYPYQWHYRDISLLDAWDHSRGAGVIVAVLDTGAKKAHPDFVNADASSQLLAGYDMISDRTIAADGDGRDSNSDDPGDRELVTDSSWHGSHVAGTIAAATNNAVGCAGIAPDAKILPVRVLGVGGGTVDDIAQGILYAAGLANDAQALPAKRADVINMSLGGPGRSQVTEDAVALARGAGTIVVAAAGNDSTDATFYSPAGELGVVTVSATDFSERRAWYSNYGSVVDVAAPGGDESADKNGDGLPDGVVSLVYANNGRTLYTPYEGTSMAAPHVSGIVALMKAADPSLTPADFDSMLAGTAGFSPITEDLGPAGPDDDFGYGLLNANLAVLAALDAASQPTTSTPSLRLSSDVLDFGAVDVERTFDATNVGRGTLDVTLVTADAPWISVTPGAVGTNTVTVDRTGLPGGVYTGVVTVVSNGGTQTVNVRMTVPSAAVVTGGDIGVVFVILIDSATNVAVAEARAQATNGYQFTFPNTLPGDYEIAAGTDLDRNGYINDEGEAFGVYPVTSAPQLVHVGRDQSGLAFPVRFQFTFQAAGTASAHPRPPMARPAR